MEEPEPFEFEMPLWCILRETEAETFSMLVRSGKPEHGEWSFPIFTDIESAEDHLAKYNAAGFDVTEKSTPHEMIQTLDQMTEKGLRYACFDFTSIKNGSVGNYASIDELRDAFANML